MENIDLWKHKNNTDVAIEIRKYFFIRSKALYELKVCWWNIGKYHNPYSMNIEQDIEITLISWLDDWDHYIVLL